MSWKLQFTPFEKDALHLVKVITAVLNYFLCEDDTHLLMEDGFRIIL